MSVATTPPISQTDTGRAFTKRLCWAAEFRMLALLAAIVGYGGLGLNHLKTKALALLIGAALVEIAFSQTWFFPSYGWICAGLLYALLILWISRTFPWIPSLFVPGSSSV